MTITKQNHLGLDNQEIKQITRLDMDAHPVPSFPFDYGVPDAGPPYKGSYGEEFD